MPSRIARALNRSASSRGSPVESSDMALYDATIAQIERLRAVPRVPQRTIMEVLGHRDPGQFAPMLPVL